MEYRKLITMLALGISTSTVFSSDLIGIDGGDFTYKDLNVSSSCDNVYGATNEAEGTNRIFVYLNNGSSVGGNVYALYGEGSYATKSGVTINEGSLVSGDVYAIAGGASLTLFDATISMNAGSVCGSIYGASGSGTTVARYVDIDIINGEIGGSVYGLANLAQTSEGTNNTLSLDIGSDDTTSLIIAGSVYGATSGAKINSTVNGSTLNINSGTIKGSVYGISDTNTSSLSVNISGGSVEGYVYAAKNATTTGSSVNMTGGVVEKDVYVVSDSTINGYAAANITSGTISGNFYGINNSTVQNQVTINISGEDTLINESVYGATLNADVPTLNLNITDSATINGNVYGATTGASLTSSTTWLNMNFDSSTIKGSIYGATSGAHIGVAKEDGSLDGIGNLSLSFADTVVSGDIYGAVDSDTIVEGNLRITLDNSSQITGNIYATDGLATVVGDTMLQLKDYGEITDSILSKTYNFTTLEITGNSTYNQSDSIADDYISIRAIDGGTYTANDFQSNVNNVTSSAVLALRAEGSDSRITVDSVKVSINDSTVLASYEHSITAVGAVSGGRVTVNGDVNLEITNSTINGSVTLVSVDENGGVASVTGDAAMTLMGDNVKFGENITIYGGSSSVNGVTSLNFGSDEVAFSGQFSSIVSGFDAINIAQSSSVSWVNYNSLSNDSASINNYGSLSIVMDTSLLEGDIVNLTITNSESSVFKVYGGYFDSANNCLKMGSVDSVTVDDSTSVATFTTTSITTNSNIEIKTDNSSEVVDVMLSFNLADTSSETVATSAKNVTEETDIGELTTLSAWKFDIELDEGDTVVLTYYIGSVEDSSLLALYHIDDTDGTTDMSDSILSYDGEYIVFEVDSFSTWAVTTVPEPSTYAMIFGALALGLAVYRRRK